MTIAEIADQVTELGYRKNGKRIRRDMLIELLHGQPPHVNFEEFTQPGGRPRDRIMNQHWYLIDP